MKLLCIIIATFICSVPNVVWWGSSFGGKWRDILVDSYIASGRPLIISVRNKSAYSANLIGKVANKLISAPSASQAFQKGAADKFERNLVVLKSSSGPPSNARKKRNTQHPEPAVSGVRVNKCLPGLSRRGADEAVEEKRVMINANLAKAGDRVEKGDIIRLDGKIQHWEGVANAKKVVPSAVLEDRSFVYLKYWKSRGVTCTSDPTDKTNIITAGRFDLFPQRLFTVGRLDKDSTGLILLTSDGRVNNAMLSPSVKKEKIYLVDFDHIPSDAQITSLREGIVITTMAQRASARPITAKTLPCQVTRIGGPDSRRVEFVLTEGRNRQIRKMAEAVGLQVVGLHRTMFAGIGLKGLSEGNWAELSEKEMKIIQSALKASSSVGRGRGGRGSSGDEEEWQ